MKQPNNETMSNYETVIGLEIHVQLKTKSKMFCGCANMQALVGAEMTEKPNTRVCPVCMGFPGVLPTMNKRALEWTIKTGLALNCKINKEFNFDRKHYFYPDLPKGYQISQYESPIASSGKLLIETDEGQSRQVCINRVHLEEDAGKLAHPVGANYSLVDLNRAGTPLMEVVTEPDLKSPKEAKIFLQKLRSIIRYLDVSDANMEAGNLRCDANISLKKASAKELGAKVEIKNINSFKMLEQALEYEIKRQTEILEEGENIVQETRGWSEPKQKTISQRGKEEALDYRYFPEPDLPPVSLSVGKEIDIEKIKSEIPELPIEKQKRFETEYGLSTADAATLALDQEVAFFFEKAIENAPEAANGSTELRERAKKLSNWILTEIFGWLKKQKKNFYDLGIEPQNLGQLIDLIDSGKVSGKIAKEILEIMLEKGGTPYAIIEKRGMSQLNDQGELEKIIEGVISKNPKVVAEYKAGKIQVLGFLVGQVMAKTKGQANPEMTNEILRERLL